MTDHPSDYHNWQYFLALESDLVNLSRYIDFQDADNLQNSDSNAKAYSIELARIFLMACAECENIGKIIAGISKGNMTNISEKIIDTAKPEYKKLPNQKIDCPAHNLTFTPWQTWSQEKIQNNEGQLVYKNPDWWTAHNNVKHNRLDFYKEANLFNTLNAVAGLMCLLFHQMQQAETTSGPNSGVTYKVVLPPSLAPKFFIPKKSGLGFGNTNWVWWEE